MSAIWGIVNFKHSVNESDADTLKSQKVDFYMSNVMSENTLKRNEDININNNNESILLKSTSSLKTSTNFNRDINTVIAPLSPNKTSYNKFISNENIEQTKLIIKYHEEHPDARQNEISKALGISKGKVNKIIQSRKGVNPYVIRIFRIKRNQWTSYCS